MSWTVRPALPIALLALTLAGSASAQEAEPEPEAPDGVEAPDGAETPDATAEASPHAPPNNRWTLRGAGYVTGGPFKATGLLGVHYRHIYHRDDSIILDMANVSTGFDAYVNPSTPGVKLWFMWQPLAVLKLEVSYDAILYTSLPLGYGYGLTFPSPAGPYDGDTLKARKGEEEVGMNHRLTFKPTVQAKVGPIVLVNETEISGWFAHGPTGEWWYETFYDTLIKRGELDGVIMNRTLLAGEAWTGGEDERLLVGAVNQYVYALGSTIERERVGAAIIFTPFTNIWGIARPTFVVMSGVTLIDPNRQYTPWVEGGIFLSWDFDEY